MIQKDDNKRQASLIIAGIKPMGPKEDPKEDPMDAFRAMAQDLIEGVKSDNADMIVHALKAFIEKSGMSEDDEDQE